MKNTYSYLFYFFIAVFLIGTAGCNKKSNISKPEEEVISLIDEEIESDVPVTIQLSGSKDYEHTFKFTDLVEKVEYIPLETTDDCLLGDETSVIKFTEEFIFIKYNGSLYLFDRQGKFIRRINRQGQGPGECYAKDIGIDETNRLIYIFDNRTLSVNIFDFNGSFIKRINNPFKNEPDAGSPSSMGCDRNGNILFTFNNIEGKMKYKYVVMNNEGEILYRCPNYDTYELKEGPRVFSMTPYPIYEYRGRNYYPYRFNDTIFRINDDYSCSPAWIVKIPKRVTLEEDLKTNARIIDNSALNGKNFFIGIRESRHNVYVLHSHRGGEYNRFLSIYNKQTRQLTENINPLITNDWDGGMAIDYIYILYEQQENVMYKLFHPFKMKEQFTDAYFSVVKAEYPEAQKALQTMVKSLQENDNPVIMIITLK